MKKQQKFFDSSLCTLHDESGTLRLFSLAVPIFMSLVFNLLLGTVNTLALTRVSSSAVTAVNDSNTVIGIPLVLINMAVNGMLVLLSLSLGGGRHDEVHGIYKTGLIFSAGFSVALAIVLNVFSVPILRLMSLSGAALQGATVYLRIRAAALVFIAITNCATAMLRAHGFARPTMTAGIISNLINAGGSVFVVSPFYSGDKIIGVAVMAVLGQLFGAVYALISLRLAIGREDGRFSSGYLRHILSVGIPGGISLLAYNISTVFSTSVLTNLGEEVINVKVYVSTVSGYTYLFGLAIAQSAAMMIGRHVGGGHYDAAKRLFLQTVRTVPLLNLLLSTLVFLFSNQIITVFTKDPQLISTAHTVFLIDIAVEFFRGISHVGENSLCSVEDTVFTSSVSIPSSFIIGIFGCWLFSVKLNFGIYGYYAAAVLDEAIRSTVYRIRFQKGSYIKRFRSSLA